MPQTELELIISARDEASRQLQNVTGLVDAYGRSVKAAGDETDKFKSKTQQSSGESDKLGHSVYETSHAFRTMSDQLLYAVNPSLGETVTRITLATRVAGGLSVGMGALVVGGAALSAGLTALALRYNETVEKQVQFNQAMREADPSVFVSKLRDAQQEADRFAQALAKSTGQLDLSVSGVFGRIAANLTLMFKEMREQFTGADSPEKKIEEMTRDIALLNDLFGKPLTLAKFREEIAQTTQAEAAFAATQAATTQELERATQRQIKAIQDRTRERVNEAIITGQQAAARPGADPQFEATLAAGRVTEIVRQGELELARTRQAQTQQMVALLQQKLVLWNQEQAEEERLQAIEGERLKLYDDMRRALEALVTPTGGRPFQDLQTTLDSLKEFASPETAQNLQRALETGTGYEGIKKDLEDLIRLRDQFAQGDIAQNQRDAVRAEQARQSVSQQQLEHLAREQELRQAILQSQQEQIQAQVVLGNLTPAEAVRLQALTQLQAAYVEINALQDELDTKLLDPQAEQGIRQRMDVLKAQFGGLYSSLISAQQRLNEQFDPLAGFRAGLIEIERAYGGLGASMYRMTVNTGQAVEAAFSDFLFYPLIGQFDKLADVAKQAGKNILRAFTDELSRGLVSSITRPLLQSLGGLSPGFIGPGVGSGGGAGPSVAGIGNLFNLFTSGTPAETSSFTGGGGGGLAASSYTLGTSPLSIQAGLGDTTGTALTFGAEASTLNMPATSGTGGLAGTLGGAAGVGISAIGGAYSLFGSGAGAAGAAVPSTISLIGTVGAGVVSAAALGFTVYSALQGPPTFQNVAISAVSGAAAGAGVGLASATLAGLILGTAISPGYGTLIGLILGAIIGGVAAAFGHGETPGSIKRRADRTREAGVLFGDLQEAVKAADAASRSAHPLQAVTAFDQALINTPMRGGARYALDGRGTPTAAGVIRRIATGNVAGNFMRAPWNWPPREDLREIAALDNYGLSETAFGNVGSVGEMMAGVGIPAVEEVLRAVLDARQNLGSVAQDLVRRALRSTRAGVSDLLAGPAVPGVTFEGGLERFTITTAEQAESRFAGQDILTQPRAVVGAQLGDELLLDELMNRLIQRDRDRNLGAFPRDLPI